MISKFIFRILTKCIKVLISDASPQKLGISVCLGMTLAFCPTHFFFTPILLSCTLLFRLNIMTILISYLLYSLLAPLLDPYFHLLGSYLLLKTPFLTPFWITLYNLPLMTFTGFNNTLILGSLLSSFLLSVPLYFFIKKIVLYIRLTLIDRIVNSKRYKRFLKTSIGKWTKRLLKVLS